jgi:hypothetical protein
VVLVVMPLAHLAARLEAVAVVLADQMAPAVVVEVELLLIQVGVEAVPTVGLPLLLIPPQVVQGMPVVETVEQDQQVLVTRGARAQFGQLLVQ